MGIAIDLAMNNLNGILTEATEGEDSVCYVTENDAETLQVAINTMHKYQKIQEIMDKLKGMYYYSYLEDRQAIEKIHEVIYGDDD